MTKEIHLFVIWKQGILYFNQILAAIESVAEILDVYHYACSKESSITIQQKLYNISFADAQNKCQFENYQEFIVIILRLKHSIYITVNTHWGYACVEKDMYEIKNTLRKVLNIPFGVHSTIDSKEAKHDIFAMTGRDITSYANYPEWDRILREVHL